MSTGTDLCVQDHTCPACRGDGCSACYQKGHTDARAADGIRLCRPCRRHLAKLIDGLPARYADLEECLSVTGTSGDRVSGSSSTPLPINTAVADHRDQIRHDLVWWCIYVSDARGLSLPSDSEPRTLAPWLARHADWLAADPVAAEECLPTMRSLTGNAWRLIDPDGRKRIKVGPCRECGEGTLYATVRAEEDDRPSAIDCDSCEFTREPSQWLRFGRTYQRQTLKEVI